MLAVFVAGSAKQVSADSEINSCVCLSGNWSGCWRSHCTGHNGRLRAHITRCDACHYECRFTGTFFKVFPFCYKVTLTVTGQQDGVVYFSASKPIPLFGGNFTCCGHATCCEFKATYRSKKDQGVFTMTR